MAGMGNIFFHGFNGGPRTTSHYHTHIFNIYKHVMEHPVVITTGYSRTVGVIATFPVCIFIITVLRNL